MICMATRPAKSRPEFDVIEPTGKRVVIRKDDNKRNAQWDRASR